MIDKVRIIGIDPGKKGAMVVVEERWTAENPRVIGYYDTPAIRGEYDEAKMARWVADGLVNAPDQILVYLECPDPGPRTHAATAAGLHRNVGFWRGLFAARYVPVIYVRPKDWQRAVSMGMKWGGKNTGAQICDRRLPGLDILGPRGGLLDGRSDAGCLALYGWDRQQESSRLAMAAAPDAAMAAAKNQ